MKQLGESDFINRLRQQFHANGSVAHGIGDDAAVIKLNNHQYQLMTTDMLVEGTHFDRSMTGYDVGYKAFACNISDISAMGGVPQYALVSLGISPSKSYSFVQDIYQGMKSLANQYHIKLVGGDTVRSPQTIVNVAMTGGVPRKDLVLRRGAKPGDIICVSGALGRSLETKKHCLFVPRLKEAQYLVKHAKPSAMMDISDGLYMDLSRLISESSVGAILHLEDIPRAEGASMSQALYDGEDFELLFTMTKQKWARLAKARYSKCAFTSIGEITPLKGRIQMKENGRIVSLKDRSFRHF